MFYSLPPPLSPIPGIVNVRTVYTPADHHIHCMHTHIHVHIRTHAAAQQTTSLWMLDEDIILQSKHQKPKSISALFLALFGDTIGSPLSHAVP